MRCCHTYATDCLSLQRSACQAHADTAAHKEAVLANASRRAATCSRPLQRAWAAHCTNEQRKWIQAAKTTLFAAENGVPIAVAQRMCRQLLPALSAPNCPQHYTSDDYLWEIVEALGTYFQQKLVEVRSALCGLTCSGAMWGCAQLAAARA